jgi:K+-transporting ATPase KdpF subunit
MKLYQRSISIPPSAESLLESVADVWTASCRKKLPLGLFFGLCCNAIFAPAVFAATGGDLSKVQAWAIALLGLTVIALAGYLFVVMFQPERF